MIEVSPDDYQRVLAPGGVLEVEYEGQRLLLQGAALSPFDLDALAAGREATVYGSHGEPRRVRVAL